ncbi:MAG: hypothetical protein SFV55_10865 [Haliscomenobacter sp.]|uniref:hypothetical protein n=1 Tax=Haliscomenobacter sp. TaxID=2717303 RepID=UPI0029B5180E|nr:hypothetical protein [Haliscomenobacter sp.]MDX2068919.1 hypothetical protein [Haliscomenobacter sp.]
MLTSIEGFYENGEIHLDEIPLIKDKIKIVVTFLSKIEVNPAPKRRLGSFRPTNYKTYFDKTMKFL